MFTRLLLSVLLFLTTGLPLFAQWDWVDNSVSNSYERVNDVVIDDVRDVIFSVGFFNGSVNFPEIGSSAGGEDGFVMKHDLAGNVIWAFSIGGTSNDRVNGVTVDETTGNIFITGYTEGSYSTHSTSLQGVPGGASGNVTGAIGNQDAFVSCYNVFGNLIWKKIIGGADVDRGMDITVNAGGVYATGFYTNSAGLTTITSVIPTSGNINHFVIALNSSNGTTLWDAVLGSNVDDYQIPFFNSTVKRTGITSDDTTIYLATYFYGALYNVYDGADVLSASITDPNFSNQDFVVTSFTNIGNHNWSVLYDNASASTFGVDITNDCSGVYVSGTMHNAGVSPGGVSITSVHDNFFISKLNKVNGTEIWLDEFESDFIHDDYFVGIEADGYGNLYAVGRLRGTSVALGTDLNFTSGQSFSEVMITHLRTDGSFQSFEVIPGSNYSWGMSIATYKDEKYVIGGYYNNSITFGSYSPSSNSDNAFIAARTLAEPFEYISASGNGTFCNFEANPTPILNLPLGGTFSGPSQVVFLDIMTGEIDLSTSTIGGPYTITYSGYPLACGAASVDFQIYILPNDDPSFAYSTIHFCNNGPNQIPTSIATPGGTFTAPSGLILANSLTGEIDVVASTVGGPYALVYSTNGLNCPSSDTIGVYIDAAPDPSFGYSLSNYCANSGTISPSFTTTAGGIFSAPAGIIFLNNTTGEIDINASTIGGPYSIQYLVSNTYCQDSTTFALTIDPSEDASFTFTTDHFCNNEPNPLPTSITTPGGTFTSLSGLVSVNSSTGEIDVAASTVGGPYYVVYTTNGLNCPASDSLAIYIEDAPDPFFAYSQTAFCSGIGTILPSSIALPGGIFSGPAEIVFLNTNTGEIDLNTSTIGGPYTIQYVASNTYCQDSATFTLTIDPLEDASFSYAVANFCNNEPNPVPISIAFAGGTFSGPLELVFANAITGEIDVTNSTVGGPYYLVYNTIGATCPSSDSVQVYIEEAPDPSFAYNQSAYCSGTGTILPSSISTTGGIFTAPAGIVFINSTTGEIDLDNSTTGGPYTIQYYVWSPYCQDSSTFSLTIDPSEDASFTFAGNNFCVNEPNPSPTSVTTTGGTFLAPVGLVLANSTTGEINVANSTVGGPYSLVYTTGGSCPASYALNIYIEAAPDASFAYGQSAYCSALDSVLPSFIAVPGGIFNGPPGIVFENTTTGEIDIDECTIGGPYTIQYLVSNAYCQESATFSLTIYPTDDASFTFANDHFCNNEVNPFPSSITTVGGTFSGPTDLVLANSSTGEIDVSTSTVGGPYYLVYTTSGVNCPASDSIQVYIEAAPDPSFTYGQTTFCTGLGTSIIPSSVTLPGGTFSGPAELVFINTTTGEIDLEASTAGGPYTVQYLVSNNYCQKSTTFDITIVGLDNLVSVDYSASEYCVSDVNQIPIIDGVTGGTFNGPNSIDIVNSTSGEFSPSTSTAGGPYLIEYVTPGACPDSIEMFLTIYAIPSAYAGEDQEFTFTLSTTLEADLPITGNGEWSTLSSGLIADEFNPNSDVSNLSLGTNTFVWTVSNGVCPSVSDEVNIVIQDLFIPQALTPNDDGKNDLFVLYSIDEVTCSLQIFNRWGQIVYKNSDYQNEWFGQNSKGEELKNDTYFYVILIDDSISYNGYVVLKK